MAKPKLQYGIGNSASTTLSSSITNTDTSVPLTSDTNFAAKTGAGMVIMDEDAATEELAYSTGKSGSSLTIPLANRGLEGGSAQAHDSATSIKGVLSVGMWNDLVDSLLNVLDQTTGAFSALKDANGNEILKAGTTASAVNEVTITNAATGGVPTISATGGDTNIDVALKGKGTGGVKLGTGTVSVTDVLDEDDMATDSAVKLATQQSIKKYVDDNAGGSTDGWTSVSDTWTYASATTITVPSNANETYEKGDKIRLKQGGSYKYWYIAATAATLLTIIVTDDYTLADAAVTDVSYSKDVSPIDFPVKFTFTPTWTGFSTDPTQTLVCWVVGSYMHVTIACNGVSDSTTFNFTLPRAKSSTGYNYFNGQAYDNGSWQNVVGIMGVTNTTTAKVGKTISTQSGNTFGGFTASGNKGFNGYFVYPF